MPHTLLVADDSVTIQRVIELTFADEDIHVLAVSDGDQAIARIEAAPPDIILADIGMPGKNGYEVAQYVKQSPRLAHIPVVLLTGAFEPVDQARALEMGCDGVLAKPFEPQLVIGRVRELLGRAASPAAGGAPRPAPAAPAGEPANSALAEQLFGGVTTGPPKAAGSAELSGYFDRLGQAFAELSASPAPPPAPAHDVDWFSTVQPAAGAPSSEPWDIAAPPGEPQDLQLSASGDVPRFEEAAVPALAPPEPPASGMPAPPESIAVPAPAPVVPAAAAPLPSLAEAFTALLAAEQQAGSPLSAAHWPSAERAAAAASAAPAAITDEVIEEVARRVLARLSDSVVRERVPALVSAIAERLVREEIDRLKRSIS